MHLRGQLARQALKLSNASPHLLFGAGVVGVVGSTVLACRATLKIDDVLVEAEEKIQKVTNLEHENYSEQDRQGDLKIVKIQTAVKIVKLYVPAVVVGTVSIAALTKSHNILTNRYAAVVSAYAALEEGFAQYRERVVDKYGEEEDRNFRYGAREVEIVKEGEKSTVTRVGNDDLSIYARFFDPASSSWNSEPEYNFIFLKCQQQYANDLLKSRGHVFLNEVYDMLGLDRSKAGSVVGWVLHPDISDNFIDFGIFTDDEATREFVNGREGSVLLDFNVDGVIYDKIDTPVENSSWHLRN